MEGSLSYWNHGRWIHTHGDSEYPVLNRPGDTRIPVLWGNYQSGVSYKPALLPAFKVRDP